MAKKDRLRRPDWLKVTLKTSENFHEVNNLVSDHSLHTVCQEARCPNIYECWNQRTATFMILGDVCTRHCGFCSVRKGIPSAPDPDEPENTAAAAEKMGLDYVVLTSVDRDDLPDEGAGHFARTIEALRARLPGCKVEVLIPDFNGRRELLSVVLEARPDVLGHNVETVEALYRRVRPVASYGQSLGVLEASSRYRDLYAPGMRTKCGIMVGLGESTEQILATIEDIAATGCDIMTIGQYLSPKHNSLAVEKFYTPEEFAYLKDQALKHGIKHAESAPLVRSSYHAHNQFENSGS